MKAKLIQGYISIVFVFTLLVPVIVHSNPEFVTMRENYSDGPRKAVIGTSIFPIFELNKNYPGLEKRLQEIGDHIDRMAEDAREQHGCGLDLGILAECVLNPSEGNASERAFHLEGNIEDYFAAKAREHNTYLIICLKMFESADESVVSNAAVLFDRTGKVAGIYRKAFTVAPLGETLFEDGVTPGKSFPVFDTDFGRLGILICYDAGFEDGWEALAAQGAELVAWPTFSPQTVVPRMYARRYGMYVASATPRDNASIFDPVGQVVAQTTQPGGVLTHRIDLDYRIVHWQPDLLEGKSLSKVYGDRIGFRYSSREDYGIFWSNDPDTPISEMLKSAGLETDWEARQRIRNLISQKSGCDEG